MTGFPNMEYSFPKYLLSKQSVDDRSLNKDVLHSLKTSLPPQPIRIIEVGAGIGTMLKRLVAWDVISTAEVVLVDVLAENMEYASGWIKSWAGEAGLSVAGSEKRQIRLIDSTRDIRIRLEHADLLDIRTETMEPADLLIAHALLDLLPMPGSLQKLLSLTKDLAWLTINFDGMTCFEPAIDPVLDESIERLYHRTMDTRKTGGDSRSGRHLFGYLRNLGTTVLAAGASDWVVYATNGIYPADEEYFLHFNLHFIEDSLTGYPGLDPVAFSHWLRERRRQIERGELVYIAHQMDFLVKQNHEKSV